MDWADLMGEQHFKPVAAYRRSKIANLLHSLELHRRLSNSSQPGASDTTAVAAHPGIVASTFWENAAPPNLEWAARVFEASLAIVFSTAAQGAEPLLHAAVVEDVEPGCCYGPRIAQRWGRSAPVRPSPEACDPDAARRLWSISEELTGMQVL
jgi:hypothetical protein